MLHVRISIVGGLVAWFLFAGICVAGEANYTIAVASDSRETTGRISGVAARAAYFLFFDNNEILLETVANPHANVSGGAGPRVANFLADKQIKIVIAGRFGTKMSNALSVENIEYLEKQGKITDEVKGVIHAK